MLSSITTVAAQGNASVAAVPPISTADLGPQETDWKSQIDYSTILSTERANAAVELAAPTTKEPAFALYTAYDRMLEYMQTDLTTGAPIEEIAENNFKKVTQESHSDPALVNMDTAEFNTLFDALLNMLHQ